MGTLVQKGNSRIPHFPALPSITSWWRPLPIDWVLAMERGNGHVLPAKFCGFQGCPTGEDFDVLHCWVDKGVQARSMVHAFQAVAQKGASTGNFLTGGPKTAAGWERFLLCAALPQWPERVPSRSPFPKDPLGKVWDSKGTRCSETAPVLGLTCVPPCLPACPPHELPLPSVPLASSLVPFPAMPNNLKPVGHPRWISRGFFGASWPPVLIAASQFKCV